jgi:hypothetical protein
MSYGMKDVVDAAGHRTIKALVDAFAKKTRSKQNTAKKKVMNEIFPIVWNLRLHHQKV